jgi:hypothetical protein
MHLVERGQLGQLLTKSMKFLYLLTVYTETHIMVSGHLLRSKTRLYKAYNLDIAMGFRYL